MKILIVEDEPLLSESVAALLHEHGYETDDRMTGLDCGADYYLGKPFDTRELLACINALLRRQGVQVDSLTFGDATLELSSATLVCHDSTIRLSAKEFEIMRLGNNSASSEN